MESWVLHVLDDSIRLVGLHVVHLKFRPLERFIRQPDLDRVLVWVPVDVKIAEFGLNLGWWTANQSL